MTAISTDKNLLDIEMIHTFLTESYWAKGRSIEEVRKSIENSLNFGIYLDGIQIGFARIATDYLVFAYLMDVFIVSDYRGKGYSKRLIRSIMDNPQLKNVKTWMLKTSDAHGLYKQFDFTELQHPEKIMEKIIK